jgi:hypothetical protein
MRTKISLMCFLFVACSALAQTTQSSLIKLNGLKVGQKIQVVETNSTKHSGTFLAVSDSAVSFRDSAGEKSIPMPDIRSVSLVGTNHRFRHTLIGLGVGAGAGAGICTATWESHGFLGGKGTGAAVGAGLGGLSGIVVGVLLPSHDTIYRATSH